MKKKKVALALVMAVLLVIGGSSYSKADMHEHKYSFWANELYYSSNLERHPYYENGVYKYCDVVGYHYRKVLKCACGDYTYGDYWIVPRHMQCGQ